MNDILCGQKMWGVSYALALTPDGLPIHLRPLKLYYQRRVDRARGVPLIPYAPCIWEGWRLKIFDGGFRHCTSYCSFTRFLHSILAIGLSYSMMESLY